MGQEHRQRRFAVLYRASYTRILGYALRRTRSSEDAADVVAETFLIAWRRLDEVPAGLEGRLWLYGVARRVLANHLRSERRRSRLGERLREELSSFVPTTRPVAVDVLAVVDEALHRLRDEDREILRLVVWEELSHEEVGKVLGCSANAAKIRLHRARRRLADLLGVEGFGVKRPPIIGHEGRERPFIETEEIR